MSAPDGSEAHRVDVRSIQDAPRIVYDDVVPVWQFVLPDEMHAKTNHGTIELIIEFELVDGKTTDEHQHLNHEFYYITAGRGTMIVDGEQRDVAQGDFVWVPSNVMHQLRPASARAPLRCLAITVRPGD